MERPNKSKHSLNEVETPAVSEAPVGSCSQDEETHDLEELRRMSFVTVDEVGEEEEEDQGEMADKKYTVTSRSGRAKRRARQRQGKLLQHEEKHSHYGIVN